MSRIDIDFVQARQQASEIEEIANTLKVSADREIQDVMAQLGNAWQGENAQLYLKKVALLKGQVAGTATELQKIAQKIRDTARRIYEAEKEAERIANERTSK